MNIRRKSIVSTLASLFLATGVAFAAETPAANASGQGAERGKDVNRMQGGMGGMMGSGQPQPRDDTMHGDGMMGRDGMMSGTMGHGMMGHGMMGPGMMGPGMMGNGAAGGMMDMMGMMHGCAQMMNARGPMSAMPKLPPGNEKLQLQMQGEMMQKMGEILSSYAARIPDTPRRP